MCDDNHPCAIAYGCFSTTNQNTYTPSMHPIEGANHIPPIKAIVLLCLWDGNKLHQINKFAINAIVLYCTNSLELCELLYMAKQLLLSFLKNPKKNMKKCEQTHSHVGDDMSPKRTVVNKKVKLWE